MHSAPFTNSQVNFYNESLAYTADGMLTLRSINKGVTYDTGGYEKTGEKTTETRHLQTAMLQGWDKFCFQEGIAEISVQLPGKAGQPGLWPAFWMMGNMGRATYARSTNGMWPWNYNQCVEVRSLGVPYTKGVTLRDV